MDKNSSKDSFNRLVEFWIKSAENDFETMLDLYKSKRFNWSLFIGHLVIEKLLKAYYIRQNNEYPPFIHNLLRLAEKSHLELNSEQKVNLATFTTFNINARYDDYKQNFYKKCTPDFTKEWIEKIKTSRLWMLELLK